MKLFSPRSAILSACFSAWLCAVAICTPGLTGCSSFPLRTYQTQKAADVTIEAAMGAWGDYVDQYHPPVEQEQKVKTAFDRYQSAQLVLCDTAIAYSKLKESRSGDPAQAEAALVKASTEAAAALADLFRLISSFGVKI